MRKDAGLVAALVAACMLVVVLAWQNRALRSSHDALVRESARPDVGAWVPQVPVESVDGRAVVLGAPRTGTQILYFFDPDCPYCRASEPALRKLQSALQRRPLSTALVALARDADCALETRMHARGLALPLVASDARIESLFGLKTVPLLIAIDWRGRVVYSHAGQVNGKDDVHHLLTALRAMEGRAAVASERNAR